MKGLSGKMKKVNVIGAGLAGCEAAWQLAKAGVEVDLYEMKPVRFSPAHHKETLAELVCSNSLKAERVESAGGLLKEEMRRLGSLLVPCAYECRVPAGGALAVDRDLFSQLVTEKIEGEEKIRIRREEFAALPEDDLTIIATGPLTSEALAAKIAEKCGGSLSFYDAAAPIVTAESLDMSKIFAASRYGKGGDDAYLNCPLDREQYERFHDALIHAEGAEHDTAVVATQVTVDGHDALGLQLEEHGVDELHHVVAPPPWQQRGHLGHERQSAELARAAGQVLVARIVFPEVAVAGHGHVVAQVAQALGQRVVNVAVFA